MNRALYIGIAMAVSLALCGQVSAAESHRVAFVNAQKVVEDSPQYEAARAELESEFSRRNQDLVAKQKQLKQLEDKLERDAAVMSDSEVKRLERDILSRRRKLKSSQAEFREDFTLRRNELINKLRRQVAEVVREVGKEQHIDLIVSDGVVFFSKRIDISDAVLEKLKETYKTSKK